LFLGLAWVIAVFVSGLVVRAIFSSTDYIFGYGTTIGTTKTIGLYKIASDVINNKKPCNS
jgi:hypothetical protein